jgi:putative MATE family efflux protein
LAYIAAETLLGVGGNALFSIRLGQGDHAGAERVLGNAFVMQLAAGAAFALAGSAFLPEILMASGASPASLAPARDYMLMLLFGLPAGMMGNGLNNFVRSTGHPRRAMINQIGGVALNVFLDWLLMFRMDMGIRGAALATVLSMALSCAMVMQFFLARRSPVRLRLRMRMPSRAIMSSILRFGFSPCLLHIGIALLVWLENGALKNYGGGDVALAAMAVAQMALQLCYMPLFGITQAMQSIVGYNWGADRPDRVKRALNLSLLASAAWVVALLALLNVFPTQFARLFFGAGGSAGGLDLAVHAIRIAGIGFPLLPFVFATSVYLTAIGENRRSAVYNLIRTFAWSPATLIFLPRAFGFDGILWAAAANDIAASLLGLWLLRREYARLRAMIG